MNLTEYLFTLKVQELREICKQSNIIGISRFTKSALVDTMKECNLVGIPEGLCLTESPEEPLPTIPEQTPVSVGGACCHGSDDPECKDCEPIILHLPLPHGVDKTKDKWLSMFKKGKEILDKAKKNNN